MVLDKTEVHYAKLLLATKLFGFQTNLIFCFQMKADMIELKDAHAVKVTSIEASAASQKQEAVNKVILEHEIEMESLRSQMENSEKIF